MQNLQKRLLNCGLELNLQKKKIVYCKDYRRQEKHENVKFDFPGYSFQPRITMSKKTGKLFLGYDCAISIASRKRIAEKMRQLEIRYLTHKRIVDVAQYLNPYIRGWINYFGKFRMWELNPIFQLLRKWLVKWSRQRYKRYKTSLNRAYEWLERIRKQFPYLFYQWQLGFR